MENEFKTISLENTYAREIDRRTTAEDFNLSKDINGKLCLDPNKKYSLLKRFLLKYLFNIGKEGAFIPDDRK